MNNIKKKVLVADDDPSILEVIKLILEEEGYDVITAVDGEAIYKMEKEYPDIFLLDIWMSGMDGRDVCKFVKANTFTKNIPVVMISANKDTERIAKESGANDFLSKPFEMDDLLNMVKKYI